jgi:outer membrane protein assembly factor BamA
MKFVFKFGYIGDPRPLVKGPLSGRLIESIEVGGYEGRQTDEMWARMKTRAGEPYDQKVIDEDWQMLLDSGPFDRQASTVRIEQGERGGLVVVFELKARAKP